VVIITDAPEDAQGNIVVHAYFGVKNNEEYALTVAAGDANKTDAKDWATITEISWKAEQPDGTKTTEEKAKDSVIWVCKVLLGCVMED